MASPIVKRHAEFEFALIDNLIAARKRAGLTQEALSFLTKIHVSTISNIEAKLQHAAAWHIDLWCVACKCTVSEVWPSCLSSPR